MRLPVHCLAMALAPMATDQLSRELDLMPSSTAQRLVIPFLTFHDVSGISMSKSYRSGTEREWRSLAEPDGSCGLDKPSPTLAWREQSVYSRYRRGSGNSALR